MTNAEKFVKRIEPEAYCYDRGEDFMYRFAIRIRGDNHFMLPLYSLTILNAWEDAATTIKYDMLEKFES